MRYAIENAGMLNPLKLIVTFASYALGIQRLGGISTLIPFFNEMRAGYWLV